MPFTSELDHQPANPIIQKPTASQPQQGPSATKAVVMSGIKLSLCPEKTCHCPGLIQIVSRSGTEGLPATWPRCTKYQNSFSTIFFRPLTVRLPHTEHLPSNYFSPATSSHAPNQPDLSPQANLFYSETTTLHSARCSRFVASSSDPPTGSTHNAFREVLGALF